MKQETINHCTEQIEPGRIHPDGQLNATIVEIEVTKANTLILIPTGLGRAVNGYSVIFSDKAMSTPYCGRDADGRYHNDETQIGLVFPVAPATVRLRFF